MIEPDDHHFAFLDIETTGLDRSSNYILEVAWVFTDAWFNQISVPKSFIVDQTRVHEDFVMGQIDASEFLTNMHKTSGLYADLTNPAVPKMRMSDILGVFVEDALQHGAERIPFRFAGYSVSFDREFLRTNGWYELIETKSLGFQMHHRILDISSLIQFFEGAGVRVPVIENKNAHRALDDALHAMKTVQAMVGECALSHGL